MTRKICNLCGRVLSPCKACSGTHYAHTDRSFLCDGVEPDFVVSFYVELRAADLLPFEVG
jgi:hypothetical protein